MRLPTVAAIVWLAQRQVSAHGSNALVERSTTIPLPISIPPSQQWYVDSPTALSESKWEADLVLLGKVTMARGPHLPFKSAHQRRTFVS